MTKIILPFIDEEWVPKTVMMWQARAVLDEMGLFTLVDNALKAQGGPALHAWEYSPTISRSSPLIHQMSLMLNLSEDQVDALFKQASSKKV